MTVVVPVNLKLDGVVWPDPPVLRPARRLVEGRYGFKLEPVYYPSAVARPVAAQSYLTQITAIKKEQAYRWAFSTLGVRVSIGEIWSDWYVTEHLLDNLPFPEAWCLFSEALLV
jgi:hypothetical protein